MTTEKVDTSNYVPLAMTAHGWQSGKQTTPYATVISRLKREWGSSHMKKHGYVLYLVHPDFEISQVHGDVSTPIGHPAIKIDDGRPVEWSRDGDQHVGKLISREARLTRIFGTPLGDQIHVRVGEREDSELKSVGAIGGGDPRTLLKRAKARAEEALKWPKGRPVIDGIDAKTGKRVA